MRGKVKRVIASTVFGGLFTSIAAGCAMDGVNLKETGTAQVEILSSEDPSVGIERADVYQIGGELVVSGAAFKQGPRFRSYRGHIDIAVMDPAGQTFRIGTAEYRRVPSRHRYSSFEVRFPVVAERVTLVRLVFHSGNGMGAKHLATVQRLKA